MTDDITGRHRAQALVYDDKDFLRDLNSFVLWMEADLMQHGEGPSGGFRGRAERARRAYEYAVVRLREVSR